MPDQRHLLGMRAESATAAWLTRRGWVVLARRWRSTAGELDIVALDPDVVLVAVEVKLRSSGRAGGPFDEMDRRRIRRQQAALLSFRDEVRPGAASLRIDLVALRPAAGGRWQLSHHSGIDRW